MTNGTPVDRYRTLRLLGALVGLSAVLGACAQVDGGSDRAIVRVVVAGADLVVLDADRDDRFAHGAAEERVGAGLLDVDLRDR